MDSLINDVSSPIMAEALANRETLTHVISLTSGSDQIPKSSSEQSQQDVDRWNSMEYFRTSILWLTPRLLRSPFVVFLFFQKFKWASRSYW